MNWIRSRPRPVSRKTRSDLAFALGHCMPMRTSLFAVLVCILVGCESSRQSVSGPSDAEIQNRIIGKWVCYWGIGDVHSTTDVSPWGGYVTKIEGYRYNKPATLIMGRFSVKSGDLIDTITWHSDSRVAVPLVVHGHIKQISDKLLIVRWVGMEKDSEYRKLN